MRAMPAVNYRYLFSQSNSTGGTEELDFNNATTYPLQMNGREQAKTMIACGEPCMNFGNLTTFVEQTPEGEATPGYIELFSNFLRTSYAKY